MLAPATRGSCGVTGPALAGLPMRALVHHLALLFICARLLPVFVGGFFSSACLPVQWFQIAGLGSIFPDLCRNFYLSTSGALPGSRQLSPDLASYRQLLRGLASFGQVSPQCRQLASESASRSLVTFCLRSPLMKFWVAMRRARSCGEFWRVCDGLGCACGARGRGLVDLVVRFG